MFLAVVLSFFYRLVHRAFCCVRAHRMDAFAKGAEILVLRHQRAVSRRPSPLHLVRPGARRTARRARRARAVVRVPRRAEGGPRLAPLVTVGSEHLGRGHLSRS